MIDKLMQIHHAIKWYAVESVAIIAMWLIASPSEKGIGHWTIFLIAMVVYNLSITTVARKDAYSYIPMKNLLANLIGRHTLMGVDEIEATEIDPATGDTRQYKITIEEIKEPKEVTM